MESNMNKTTKNHHLVMTKEQRAEYRAKTAETVRLKQEWAKANLRDDYADKLHWSSLASKYKITLPRWYEPATELKHIRKAMRKVGIEYKVYNDSLGFQYKEIGESNSDMPAYASVGLFLEWVDEYVKDK